MVKFSQQILSQSSGVALRRREQVMSEQEQSKQQELRSKIEQAQGTLSSAETYEQYFERYNQLPEEMKQFFTSPQEIQQTQEYQGYLQEKRSYEEEQARASEYETAIKVYTGQISTPAGFNPNSPISREAQRYVEHNPSLASLSGKGSMEYSIKKLGLAGIKFKETQKTFTVVISKGVKEQMTAEQIKTKYGLDYNPSTRQFEKQVSSDVPYYQGTVTEYKGRTGLLTSLFGEWGREASYKVERKVGDIKESVKNIITATPIIAKTISEKISPTPKEVHYNIGGYIESINPEAKSVDYSSFSKDITAKGNLDYDVEKRTPSTKSTSYKGSDVILIPKKTEKGKSFFQFVNEAGDIISTPLKRVYEKIPKGYVKKGRFGMPEFSFIKTSDTDVSVEDLYGFREEKVSKKQQDIFDKQIAGLERQPEIEKKYQEQYQTRFENIYATKISKGEITFEEAEGEFSESNIAKLIGFEYEEEIGEERKKLPFGEKAIFGLKLTGLELLKGIPIGPIDTLKDIGLTYAGIKAFKLIPPAINIGLTMGSLGYGAYKTFSPTSLPEEVGGGIITAGISGAILTYSGIKYLKSPTIKSKNIELEIEKAGDLSIRSPELRRTIVKGIYGETTVMQEYKIGKISKTFVGGRRTIISSKIKDLLKIKPIYEGIPFADRGGYSKALKKLIKYGLPELQARKTLRYYQPKIIKENLKGLSKLIYGDLYKNVQVKIEATRDITQPIKVIDEGLGIKTRRAKPIREFISGEGEQIAEIKDMPVYKMDFDIVKTFLAKGEYPYQTLKQFGKTTKQFQQLTIVQTKRTGKTFIPKGRVGDIFIGENIPYEEVLERSIVRQTVPRGRRFTSRQRSFLLEGEEPPIVNVDLGELIGIKAREIISPKKNIVARRLEDYNRKDIQELMRTIRNVYGKKREVNILKSMGVQMDIPSTIKLPQIEKSLSIKDVQNIVETKRIPKIKEQIRMRSGLKVKQINAKALSVLAGLILKEQQMPKLKMNQVIKQIERQKGGLKLKELLKQNLKMTSSLKQSLSLKQTLALLNIPSLRTPLVPKFKMPKIPTFPVVFFPAEKLAKGRKRKTDLSFELAYLPDFTSRIAGLEEEVISGKQAQALIKKVLTGLEVRRGVIIR